MAQDQPASPQPPIAPAPASETIALASGPAGDTALLPLTDEFALIQQLAQTGMNLADLRVLADEMIPTKAPVPQPLFGELMLVDAQTAPVERPGACGTAEQPGAPNLEQPTALQPPGMGEVPEGPASTAGPSRRRSRSAPKRCAPGGPTPLLDDVDLAHPSHPV